MTYDPTIPDLDNYIEDDIPAIMTNFAALADSRIVDHNLDVGTTDFYVRWANGMQLCFGQHQQSYEVGTTLYTFQPSWAAQFANIFGGGMIPRITSSASFSARFVRGTMDSYNFSTGRFQIQVLDDTASHSSTGVWYVVLGTWN